MYNVLYTLYLGRRASRDPQFRGGGAQWSSSLGHDADSHAVGAWPVVAYGFGSARDDLLGRDNNIGNIETFTYLFVYLPSYMYL